MKRVNIILFLSMSLLLLLNSLYADKLGKSSKKFEINNNHWYLSGGIGASWYARSRDYNVATSYPFTGSDSYHYRNDNKTNVMFMLEGGYQWQRGTKWFPNYSVALRYSYYNNAKREGIYSIANNTYSNLFDYKVQAQSLLAVAKLAIVEWYNLRPFIITGAGIARNNFSFYEKDPRMTLPLPNDTFPNNASMNFAYLLGLGISYQLNERWQLGLEYHYANLGEAKSGKNPDSKRTIPVSLVEQSVMLTLSYYFA